MKLLSLTAAILLSFVGANAIASEANGAASSQERIWSNPTSVSCSAGNAYLSLDRVSSAVYRGNYYPNGFSGAVEVLEDIQFPGIRTVAFDGHNHYSWAFTLPTGERVNVFSRTRSVHGCTRNGFVPEWDGQALNCTIKRCERPDDDNRP